MRHHLIVSSALLTLLSSSSEAGIIRLAARQDDADPTGEPYIPKPTCTATVSEKAYPAKPTVDAGAEPIEGQSFFYIDGACYRDTSTVDHNQGFPNKGKFFEQAFKDAMLLADQSLDWPQYGTDASDLYFGKGTEDERYSKDIHTNLEVASKWQNPQWGFDNYIVLGCSGSEGQGMGDCNAKIGADPRPIGCYVNNTVSWWWNKSYIWCCNPFFQRESIEHRYEARKDDDKDNLDLRNLVTSGSAFLHEMMHTLEITGVNGERKHIIDVLFDGSRGKRIYGPPDVAKAARIYGPSTTTLNADSYAQFASAHYWQKRFEGKVPQPSVAPSTLDESYVDDVSDNSGNYVDQCIAPPEDFNCDCGENGCSEDSAPCCANGSCKCNCTESGCPPPNPSCCASGTCKTGS